MEDNARGEGTMNNKKRGRKQTSRAKFLEMNRQIDKGFMDMCETEGIPVYANDEYGLFGQVPQDYVQWGGAV